MKDVYRVVCSENQKLYPGQVFVDFMPAGQSRQENCLNHDAILQMRRTINPGVDSVENGLILTDYGFGRPEMGYEAAYGPERRKPGYDAGKYEPVILERFRQMREAGKEKTLDVSISELAALYGFEQTEDNGSPKSAREAALIEEARRQKEIARKKAEQREYEAKKQSNLSTEQILKWKYSRYFGD